MVALTDGRQEAQTNRCRVGTACTGHEGLRRDEVAVTALPRAIRAAELPAISVHICAATARVDAILWFDIIACLACSFLPLKWHIRATLIPEESGVAVFTRHTLFAALGPEEGLCLLLCVA